MQILCFSTSSPWASVALITTDGTVLWSEQEHAVNRASASCFEMLDRHQIDFTQIAMLAADTGPGSFTGVRVGVTLAKTLAYMQGCPVLGAEAFDLIDPEATVVLPSKKGEYFLRKPGQSPIRTTEIDPEEVVGYPLETNFRPPHAARFAAILDRLVPTDAVSFVPHYLIEPSISTPKKPFRSVV